MLDKSEKIPCIVLNKSFIGSYVGKENQDAHEIIIFLQADDGNNYVYCNPYGQNVSDAENMNIDYFVVCTEEHNGRFYLEYYYEIQQSLHTRTYPKNYVKTEYAIQRGDLIEKAENEINSNLFSLKTLKTNTINEITYNGIPIKNFFPDKLETIPVTFLAGKIYKAKNLIKIEQIPGEEEKKWEYNFQRNFGYVTPIKAPQTYNKILDEIQNKDNWEEIKFNKTDFEKLPEPRTTFMDLIDMHREEECYTRLICNVLTSLNKSEQTLIIKELLKRLNVKDTDSLDLSNIKIQSEWALPNLANKKEQSGRIDILISSDDFNLIIENKVDSGINYIKDENNESINQMKRYYNHFANSQIMGNKKKLNLFVFLVPKNKILHIEEEIDRLADEHKSEYKIIDYSMIYDLINDHISMFLQNNNFSRYMEDVLYILRNLTYDNKTLCEIKLKRQSFKNS